MTSRPWAIELYSDDGSVIRHNTLVYRSGCAYSMTCGLIALDRKSADDAGRNTQVYDNIATGYAIDNGSTAQRRDHNMVRSGAATGDFLGAPTFQGGAAPTTYAGYRLTTSSEGAGRASDGLDVGIRASGSPNPTPTPTPTPTPPTDIAADALWTPPSGAKVGTAVALDGSGSKGNAPIACTWTFEDQAGTTVFETLTGCTLLKAFRDHRHEVRQARHPRERWRHRHQQAVVRGRRRDRAAGRQARQCRVDNAQRHPGGRHVDARRHPLDG